MTRTDIVFVTVECARASDASLLEPDRPCEAGAAVVPGHYTRPSLAGILSGQYLAASQADIAKPTLPDVFSRAGYTTIGVCHSPQAAVYDGLSFTHEYGSVAGVDGGALGRGSRWRERLAEHALVRRVYRHVQPKRATLERVTPDQQALTQALDAYADAPRPRFLWVHLMDSHRPYGRGKRALPDGIGRQAADTTTGVPDDAHDTIRAHYERALDRASAYVDDLLNVIGADAEWLVMGDHGEELGEDGYYFHSGYRQRTPPTITEVPVFASVDLPDELSGVDVAPLIADAADVPVPHEWDGQPDGSPVRLSFAPWAGSVNVRVRSTGSSIEVRDGESSHMHARVGVGPVKDRLQALGYR